MPVYLDHNATSPPRPEALECALPLITGDWGNPSSIHQLARRPAAAVERARRQVSRWCGARARDVVFTSGATEANHLALRGARPAGGLLISSIEHPSVLQPGLAAGALQLPVHGNGVLDLGALEEALTQAPVGLVSVMAANNEVGTLQPLAEVHRLCKAHGALLHVDAAQLPGRQLAPESWDLLTLTAHKAGGLKGAGALVVRPHVALDPQQLGGAQERGRRAGTVNPAPIAAMGAVLDCGIHPHLESLRDKLEAGVVALGLLITAAEAPRLPNTCHLRHPGTPGELIVIGLDLEGVCASPGAACSSGASQPSHVLQAMGLPDREGVRLSLGWNSVQADVDRALQVLAQVVARLDQEL